MAISYAFDGDCAYTLKYETMVIDYWKTREQAEPQNAFYQEGEMANEGARVCIDAGDIAAADRWYRMGYELGSWAAAVSLAMDEPDTAREYLDEALAGWDPESEGAERLRVWGRRHGILR